MSPHKSALLLYTALSSIGRIAKSEVIRVTKHITKSNEDYLEAILMIREEKGACRSIDVAYRLNVSKPSVSVAMANLEKMGMVVMEPTHELKLTRSGMRHARRVLERHRLLSAALMRLGVPREIAEEDACRIEHDISQASYDGLKAWFEKCEKAEAQAEA